MGANKSDEGVKPVLRIVACGSVDDGKSTLIGRLLYETGQVFEDQLQALAADSRRYGAQDGALDFALLLDGLQAEREQAITIDVAWRYFESRIRRFIVADTPGHEQYTRNMATGASNAELAIVLVDARKGLLPQTRRHLCIVAFMGVRQIVIAVNKMDLVGYDRAVFERIETECRAFARGLGFSDIAVIPISAACGDNLTAPSTNMPWRAGPTLLEALDSARLAEAAVGEPFRMAVQSVVRPDTGVRYYCGRIAAGRVRIADKLRIVPSGVATQARAIVDGVGEIEMAEVGDSIALAFVDDIDVGRGDVVCAADSPAASADQFECRLLWLHAHAMAPGRQYLFKLGAAETTAIVTRIKYREDVDSSAHLSADALEINEIGRVTLATGAQIAFEPYSVNRRLGGFVLIDRLTFETVGAGLIEFALRRAQNLYRQAMEVTPASRALQKSQKPRCIWFTGLSGSGKSTLANLLDKRLNAEGRHTYLLDGDDVRHGLNRDLGFTEADRVENIRRVAEVARLMVDAGLIVLVAFISPFRTEREMARGLFPEGAFAEVFVDTPIEECERRDIKGLYALARQGKLKNFTGLDSPYEPPLAPEARIRTLGQSAETCVEEILGRIG